jgi:hypothetical protein
MYDDADPGPAQYVDPETLYEEAHGIISRD